MWLSFSAPVTLTGFEVGPLENEQNQNVGVPIGFETLCRFTPGDGQFCHFGLSDITKTADYPSISVDDCPLDPIASDPPDHPMGQTRSGSAMLVAT